MEEQRTNAGQGLGIAGLVLGIMAIPMGIIPCTFFLGILFGLVGIVLSIVALTQAHRGFGPKGLIIAALICSLVGLSIASVWGFVISTGAPRIFKEIMHEKRFGQDDQFDQMNWDEADSLRGFEEDTTSVSSDMKDMTDSLKSLESEGQ
jgi:hypothetical protein